MTDWRDLTLDQLGRIVTGKTPPTADSENYGGAIPFVTPSDMDGRRIISDTARYLSAAGLRTVANARIPRQSVMVSCIGSDMGKAAISGSECVTNQQINSVIVDERFEASFVYYNLSVRKEEIRSAASGSAQPIMNKSTFGRLRIRVPDKTRQIAIASVLGALDDKIELNQRMNETLEAMARAIFKDWFVDFGPTRAKMEGRAPYLAQDIWSLFPDRLNDEGKPEGWEFRRVGDFAELRGGKQLEKERINSSGTIPVFGGAGVMGFTDEHNADGFVISVGRVGAYCGQFFSHRGKAWINNNASLIRQFEGVSGEWLFQSLRHADIEVIKKGAAQPFVSNTDVGNMPIIWPGERVVAWFADVAVPLMLRMEHNDAEASALVATRDFLLPKLMSGEVRAGDAATLA